MKKRRYGERIFLIIILLGVLVASNAIAETAGQMTALEKKLYEAAKIEGKLQYWDSLNLKEVAPFIKAFTNKYPGIEISYYETSSTRGDNKYFMEKQAGRKPVDVMRVEGYGKYKKEGYLMNLSDMIQDLGLAKELYTEDFDVVGVDHSVKGSAYNTKSVSAKDVPRSWEDLLNPKWKGKIATENAMDLFICITQAWGKEKTLAYLKKLREQQPSSQSGTTHMLTLLGAGEYLLGVGNNLNRVMDLQSRQSPIAFAPISPAVDKITPMVIIRDAPHPNAAKLYLRWLMSSEGQSLIDKIRQKGNPLPGSGTEQSKTIEKLGIKLLVVRSWETDVEGLQRLYQKTIGF